jgi:hypothetical protein
MTITFGDFSAKNTVYTPYIWFWPTLLLQPARHSTHVARRISSSQTKNNDFTGLKGRDGFYIIPAKIPMGTVFEQ